MKTPAFWQSKNFLSALLLPASFLYGVAGTLRRACTRPETLSVPVICIGNLTAGGAGKTPVALAVGERLKARGAFFLSRGYGGNLQGPLLIDSRKHTSHEVGDEPLLLARLLPTVVAKDRLAGARFAIAQGAKMIIMDDGFQNPAIAKTCSLLVIDGAIGLGNERLIPAGPLRESFASGIARANAVIIIGDGSLPHMDKPLLRARVVPLSPAQRFAGQRVVAFCGLAYPRKFYATLAALDAQIVEEFSFADHHPYSHAEMEKLVASAQRHGAQLVTTAKDAVRLPEFMRGQVTVVDITLTFDNDAMLTALLP